MDYVRDAFRDFADSSGFNLGTARAMVWLAQVSNEADREKIDRVLNQWGLECRKILTGVPISIISGKTRFGLVARTHQITGISFAYTDLLSLGHLATGLRFTLTSENVHKGFRTAVNSVWPDLRLEIQESIKSRRALFLTGHSSGGTLAVLTAERAIRELSANVAGVYTFGAPPPGGAKFAERYPLHDHTFRFVYGCDGAVNFPSGLEFRHVGKLIHCERGGAFYTSASSAKESVSPDRGQLLNSFKLGQLLSIMLPQLGDHLPQCYVRALGSATG